MDRDTKWCHCLLNCSICGFGSYHKVQLQTAESWKQKIAGWDANGFCGISYVGESRTAKQWDWSHTEKWGSPSLFLIGGKSSPCPRHMTAAESIGPWWDVLGLCGAGLRFVELKPAAWKRAPRTDSVSSSYVQSFGRTELMEQSDILVHDFPPTLSAWCLLLACPDGFASLLHEFRAGLGDLPKSRQEAWTTWRSDRSASPLSWLTGYNP